MKEGLAHQIQHWETPNFHFILCGSWNRYWCWVELDSQIYDKLFHFFLINRGKIQDFFLSWSIKCVVDKISLHKDQFWVVDLKVYYWITHVCLSALQMKKIIFFSFEGQVWLVCCIYFVTKSHNLQWMWRNTKRFSYY